MKHKHYDCIVAWAEGKKVETKDFNWEWVEIAWFPQFENDWEYRIKKEPVIEEIYYRLGLDGAYHPVTDRQIKRRRDLKITYQDGNAIKAEVAE